MVVESWVPRRGPVGEEERRRGEVRQEEGGEEGRGRQRKGVGRRREERGCRECLREEVQLLAS